jgi:peptide-methionine (S)-S-oxide reductase
MKIKLASLVVLFTILSCNAQTKKLSLEPKNGKAIAVFAEGCFWCSEHVLAVVGVDEAVSGYLGNNENLLMRKGRIEQAMLRL